MSCVKDISLLERYIDDELPDVLVRRVEVALETCAHCRDEVDALLQLRSVLQEDIAAAMEAAPLDGLWDQLEPELGPMAPAKPSLLDRAREWWDTRRLEAAMGLAVAAAAIAVLVWVAGSLPTTSTVEPELADAAGGDNTLIVESYEVHEGTVIIDVDPDDPTAPAVVWHFVEDEDEQG